jgi:hypothetical protein
MKSSLRIIVTGLIAQHPMLGGVAWDYVQYVIGLARLGHDVYYIEDSGEWPYRLDGGASGQDWVADDCTQNIDYLAKVMDRFGLAHKWAYHFPTKPEWFGLSAKQRQTVIESADLLINVSGSLSHPQDYRAVRRLVYIDSDPVFTQIKLKSPQGQTQFVKRVDVHDAHFTFGECVSKRIPCTKYEWRATRQPIVLSEWRPSTPSRDVFTTVMNWTSYKPLKYRGDSYGQKDMELKRFLDLPGRTPDATLEIALGNMQHQEWQTSDEKVSECHPRSLLIQNGWQVIDAMAVCHDIDSYRTYIESSKAEWSVAKNGYVLGQPGWFSCRSACYLAAGRPVVLQDTGFSRILPAGEGILPFKTVDEAVTAIEEVMGNYDRHAKTARAIAEDYFDSDKVLSRLIEQALN